EEPRGPEARLAYHQAQRRPLLDGLKRWLSQPSDEQLVEPHSSLGKALGYRPNHWATLTRLIAIPGAPRDNHLAERVLKLCMRQRHTCLVYKNTPRASIASVLTSLSATCVDAGVNAVDSLVALQEHRSAVLAHPAAWLPWTDGNHRASPEARQRQSCASWARSGCPFHKTISSSRAAKGPRASALAGHHAKRPCERRFIMSQEPWPS